MYISGINRSIYYYLYHFREFLSPLISLFFSFFSFLFSCDRRFGGALIKEQRGGWGGWSEGEDGGGREGGGIIGEQHTRENAHEGGPREETHLEICQPRSVQAIVRLKSSFHWKPSTCMAFLSLLLARNPFHLSPARSASLYLSVPPTAVSLALPLSTALSPGPEWRGGRVQGYSGAVEKYISVSSFGGHRFSTIELFESSSSVKILPLSLFFPFFVLEKERWLTIVERICILSMLRRLYSFLGFGNGIF